MEDIKKDALDHYKKMIEWAEKQDPKENVDKDKMKKEIGENWYGPDCPYCISNLEKGCGECSLWSDPLYVYAENPCCSGLWSKMNRSNFWGEWVQGAQKVYDYIEENG